MAPSHFLQIFLRIAIQNQICIAQRIVVDEIIQFGLLRHGHIQCILDPGAINGDFPPIPEQQLHAAGVHVELAGSCIVLHVCVLSALRHLYSCDFRYTFFDADRTQNEVLGAYRIESRYRLSTAKSSSAKRMAIRFWTHSGWKSTVVLLSKEHKKSEPFSYREKVRIFIVWCTKDCCTGFVQQSFFIYFIESILQKYRSAL